LEGSPSEACAEACAASEIMTARDRVFLAILDHWRTYAVPPVIRDVCKAAGVSSTSYVWKQYRSLEMAGRIVIVQRHPVPVEIVKLIQGPVSTGKGV